MSLPSLSIRQGFTSLKHRNFKLWFVGQLASLIGTWMQMTAIGFLMYELTRSAAYLGYIGFASGLPTLLFTLAGGVLSDRYDKRKVLIATQIAMMLLAALLTVITFFGVVQSWQLLIIAFLNGVANAFDAPARQSFVRELVPSEDLTNAIALNATMFNGAMAIGPAVAGFVYATIGPAACFLINTLSFVAVLVALLAMSFQHNQITQESVSALHDIKEGLRYISQHKIIRTLLFIVAFSNIIGMGYVTLLPAWAVTVLDGDSVTLGFLQSSRGFGSVLGAFMIASLGRFQFKGKLLAVGLFAYPFFLFLFASVRWLPLSLFTLICTGWGFMVLLNLSNALIQTHVDDLFRGRVMSVYSMALMGMIPLGSLLFGSVAEITNESLTVISGAGIAILFAFCVVIVFPFIKKLP